MLRGLFARRSGARITERDAAERLKARARDALGLAPDTELTASEIDCLDPGCPGLETVLLVMRPGERTRALKIRRPMEDVTEQDLRDALSPDNGGSP
jgi:hypothetical protein